ncbi:hypothetical protein EAF00_008862 [Botryotinia globosa]|nr:hypothetical protein EAF00_008862 [Botryotinia globosa]
MQKGFVGSPLSWRYNLGIDKNTQDKEQLRASLAPNIIADYTLVVPEWGQKTFTADTFVEWLGPMKLGVKALDT